MDLWILCMWNVATMTKRIFSFVCMRGRAGLFHTVAWIFYNCKEFYWLDLWLLGWLPLLTRHKGKLGVTRPEYLSLAAMHFCAFFLSRSMAADPDRNTKIYMKMGEFLGIFAYQMKKKPQNFMAVAMISKGSLYLVLPAIYEMSPLIIDHPWSFRVANAACKMVISSRGSLNHFQWKSSTCSLIDDW